MLLIFDDNLRAMRKLTKETVDLVCLSPPHHGSELTENWNTPLSDMFSNQSWVYNKHTEKEREAISLLAESDPDYEILEMCLKGFDNLLLHSTTGNMGGMRDLLTFFCPRILEMKRLLEHTGTFYYVGFVFSHYLKCFLDTLFDQVGHNEIDHSKKEIIISENTPDKVDSTRWQNTHRVSLYYTKSDKYTFNAPHNEQGSVWEGFGSREKSKHDDIPFRCKSSNALYDRWISVSSNHGDVVLDAFCGSGTALDSAHSYGRDWIGIDNAEDAIQATIYRMWKKHLLIPAQDYVLVFKDTTIKHPETIRDFLQGNKLGMDFNYMLKCAGK